MLNPSSSPSPRRAPPSHLSRGISSRHQPSFRIASSISFIAGLPFFRNNSCCLPLHTSRSPTLTLTVIGYASTRFAITFALGFTLRIADFAASNSCIPPSARRASLSQSQNPRVAHLSPRLEPSSVVTRRRTSVVTKRHRDVVVPHRGARGDASRGVEEEIRRAWTSRGHRVSSRCLSRGGAYDDADASDGAGDAHVPTGDPWTGGRRERRGVR